MGGGKQERKNGTCVTASEPNFANIGVRAVLVVVVVLAPSVVPVVHLKCRAPLIQCKRMAEVANGGVGLHEWEVAGYKADRANCVPAPCSITQHHLLGAVDGERG